MQYLHIYTLCCNNCLNICKIEKQNRTWGPIFLEKLETFSLLNLVHQAKYKLAKQGIKKGESRGVKMV